MTSRPQLTVAAIIERNRRFAVVEELVEGAVRLNQPAGHLESLESIAEGAIREVKEETGLTFVPTHLVGVYTWHAHQQTVVRICVCGETTGELNFAPSDPDIVACHWKSWDDLRADQALLRSPLVLAGVEDYLNGIRYPLALLQTLN